MYGIKNKKSIFIIIFLLITITGLYKLGFFNKVDDVRDPISVNEIDWKYLSDWKNNDRVETVVVYSPGHTFGLRHDQSFLFAQLMDKNINKIYKKSNSHSMKIRVVFNEVGVINSLYKVDKYNGKQSTFYIDVSLIEDLKIIYHTSSQKIDDDIRYNSD